MEGELLKEMVVNLPNFVFSGIAVWTLYRICNRLLDEVVRTCQQAKEVMLEKKLDD